MAGETLASRHDASTGYLSESACLLRRRRRGCVQVLEVLLRSRSRASTLTVPVLGMAYALDQPCNQSALPYFPELGPSRK